MGHLPFTIVESPNDNRVPEWVHSTPAVVHDTGQPGVYGLGAVTVAISKKLLINSKYKTH